jgi:hypothetical protein
MTDTDRELQEDRNRRWRQGSIVMLVVALVAVGLFWAGIYLLTL